jgi:hypothetical protein
MLTARRVSHLVSLARFRVDPVVWPVPVAPLALSPVDHLDRPGLVVLAAVFPAMAAPRSQLHNPA